MRGDAAVGTVGEEIFRPARAIQPAALAAAPTMYLQCS